MKHSKNDCIHNFCNITYIGGIRNERIALTANSKKEVAMCRLLAYVALHDQAATDLLEAGEFTSFGALSSLHCDGWGMAWLPSSPTGTSAHVATIRSVNRALDD